MKELQSVQRQISLKKVAITVGIGALILMIGTIAYDYWRVSQGFGTQLLKYTIAVPR